MIIANFSYGRLGNKLELAAHLIVFAETEKKVIALQYLGDVAHNFPYFAKSPLCLHPKSQLPLIFEKFFLKLVNKLIILKIIRNINFLEKNEWIFYDDASCYDNKELIKLKKSWLCTIKVWRFRSSHRIKEYRTLIRKIFTPAPEILLKGKGFINELNADIIVGVHIRWGDYKTEAPMLYHDIKTYKARMLETIALFPKNKIGFVVCSEEGKEIEELSDLNCIYPKSTAIVDLYTLAQCKYIIATSSTFSSWASYWGNVGIFTIKDKTKKITNSNDFIVNDLLNQD